MQQAEVIDNDLPENPDLMGSEVENPEVDVDMQRAIDHGWTDFETYKENGGDPDKYRGYKAFNDYHDQLSKSRGESKELKEQMKKLTEGFNKLTHKQQEDHKKELESALEQAKKDLDVDKVQEIAQEMNAIQEAEKPQSQGEPEAVVAFRQANPLIDATSPEYNAQFNTLVESDVNQRFAMAIRNGSIDAQNPDQSVIKTILDAAFESAKSAMPHLFKEEKRKPPSVGSPAAKKGTKDPVAALDSDAKEIYEIIKTTQSQEAADEFAKNLLGE